MQYYWGRVATLMMRLTLSLFEHVWSFLYVDDAMWLFIRSELVRNATVVVTFLYAIGFPFLSS